MTISEVVIPASCQVMEALCNGDHSGVLHILWCLLPATLSHELLIFSTSWEHIFINFWTIFSQERRVLSMFHRNTSPITCSMIQYYSLERKIISSICIIAPVFIYILLLAVTAGAGHWKCWIFLWHWALQS